MSRDYCPGSRCQPACDAGPSRALRRGFAVGPRGRLLTALQSGVFWRNLAASRTVRPDMADETSPGPFENLAPASAGPTA